MRGIVRQTSASLGLLEADRLSFEVALGAAGISTAKQEGDHATPAGLLALRRVLYRADRVSIPRCVVPVEPLSPDDGWCDDPRHSDYNRMVRLPHAGRHEALWREDGVYDLLGVLGWNDAPALPDRGSAIFLHVARPGLAPTEGCLALPLPALAALLAAGLTEIEVCPPAR